MLEGDLNPASYSLYLHFTLYSALGVIWKTMVELRF